MRKWYQSAWCKGLLILMAIFTSVTMVIGFVWLYSSAGLKYMNPFSRTPENYSGTENFQDEMYLASHEIMGGIRNIELFETEGRYDKEKYVNLLDFSDTTSVEEAEKLRDQIKEEQGAGKEISGEGLYVQMKDLVDWSGDQNSSSNLNVIACKKVDGTYLYYSFDEFNTAVRSGEFTFLNADQDTVGYILDDLKNKWGYEGNNSDYTIQDKDGKVLFVDYWNIDFNVDLVDKYAPVGYTSLMDVANKSAKWNGKLSNLYDEIYGQLQDFASRNNAYTKIQASYQEGNTNLVYLFADLANKKIYTNREAFSNFSTMEESLEKIKKIGADNEHSYVITAPKLSQFASEMGSEVNAGQWTNSVSSMTESDDFVFAIAVDTDYPIQDSFYTDNLSYQKIGPYIDDLSAIILSCFMMLLMSVVWLTIVAGRSSRKSEGVVLNAFDRLKTELLLIVAVGTVGGFMVGISEVSYSSGAYEYYAGSGGYYSWSNSMAVSDFVMVGVMTALTCITFLIGYLSLVRRIKAKTLWNNSILYWVAKMFKEFWRNRKCLFKTISIFCGFAILNLLMVSGLGFFAMLALIADGFLIIYLSRHAIAKQRIREGIKQISEGNLDYEISLEGLKNEDLEMAYQINNIGEGMYAAMEANMKSERLKTDLITNVSHDIKTPLTSIINYVDLLKRENFEDPRVQGYLAVLEEKAQRLKTLTEDVVEASKISSGNIKLECMNLNFVEIIQQTAGEFEEKFEARGLKLILGVPDDKVLIYADGRRLWRVLANIFNNAAKYAMTNTRVYADLKIEEYEVEFTLKNISENPLNISADELTERFIRGDVSRSTEGSGLGLSIAKNLTERQGGTFTLYLDGDLFKATIRFPKVIQMEYRESEEEAGDQTAQSI